MTSRSTLTRRVMIALAVLGLFVAGYLLVSHYSEANVLCVEGGGCDRVRQSIYSEVLGMPVALLGVLGYLLILGTLILEETNSEWAAAAPLLVFGLTLVGVLYSAYLTYLELFVILAICPYCVTSAVVMVALFGLATYRLLQAQPG
jgi:uncharacterized membrane protein